MPSCSKLLEKARLDAGSLRFKEACKLAECFGFEHARTKGSHHIYKRLGTFTLVNLQDVNGMAKPYQVRQLLDLIATTENE